MTDDPELLRLYAEEGSEEAFGELVRRHIDFVYAAALRHSRNAQRAEDITQIAFTALARQSKMLHHRAELVGWLYTTVRFTAAKTIRAEVRRQRHEQEAQLMQEIASDPGSKADWGRLHPVLDEALAELRESDRSAILLRFFKNLSFAEIGAALRLTEDAARKRVGRALDRLQGSLTKRGISSTAAALAGVMGNQTASAAPVGLAPAVTATALASGAAPALIAFVSMASAKIAVGMAAVVIALSWGMAARELLGAHRVDMKLAATDQAYEVSIGHLIDLESQAVTSRANVTGANPAAPSPARPPVEEALENARLLEAMHPEIKPVLDRFLKARCDARYQGLYGQLRLSPAQIGLFEKLMALGKSYVFSFEHKSYRFRFSEAPAPADLETNLRVLLGDSGYQQYQEYNRTAFTRAVTGQIAVVTAAISSPLNSAQVSSLNGAFAGLSLEGTEGSSSPVAASSFDWDRAFSRARGVLNPRQMTVFGGLAQQALVNQDLFIADLWTAGPAARIYSGGP